MAMARRKGSEEVNTTITPPQCSSSFSKSTQCMQSHALSEFENIFPTQRWSAKFLPRATNLPDYFPRVPASSRPYRRNSLSGRNERLKHNDYGVRYGTSWPMATATLKTPLAPTTAVNSIPFSQKNKPFDNTEHPVNNRSMVWVGISTKTNAQH